MVTLGISRKILRNRLGLIEEIRRRPIDILGAKGIGIELKGKPLNMDIARGRKLSGNRLKAMDMIMVMGTGMRVDIHMGMEKKVAMTITISQLLRGSVRSNLGFGWERFVGK